MALLFVERIKEQFGKDKEAVEIYEKATGINVKQLYVGTFLGDDVQKGALFEFYVFKQLYKINGNHRFLFNVILPTKTGTTEIDVLFLHETGLYVYECKNYGGKIYGDEKYKMWNQYLEGKKYQFYSPILQNQGHIKNLMNYLDGIESDFVYSFISFSNRAELKVTYEPKHLCVESVDDCIWENKMLIKKLPVKFSDEQLEQIYQKLLPYAATTKEQREAHATRVAKFKK